jgi:hypothetical protein
MCWEVTKMLTSLWWLDVLVMPTVRKSSLWRALTNPQGSVDLLLVVLLAFVLALIVTGRRVIVQ